MKNRWWVASAVTAAVAVAGVIGAGVWADGFGLNHPPALTVSEPTALFRPAIDPGTPEAPDFTALSTRLSTQAADPRLGTFVGQARDVQSGEIVWERNPGQGVRPASATKILTAAVALYELGRGDTVATEVLAGPTAGTVVIRAGGDVTLSRAQLDELAQQLAGRSVDTVLVDTGIWPDAAFAGTWDEADIDAGYIAPVEAVMIEGGRLSGSHGDVPRSHTPALDVAAALAQRLGAEHSGTGTATGTEVLARVESDTLEQRLSRMMEESDNVMAEGIAREVAQSRGLPTDARSTAELTLDILGEHGFNLEGVSIVDNSGLSFDNVITPRLLDDVLTRAATESELRPLLGTLPIAHATGTLGERYEGLSGAGWVRAKTGTLTDTSALAGVVTSDSGRVFTFAFVSNDSAILDARAALDEMASILRDF